MLVHLYAVCLGYGDELECGYAATAAGGGDL